MIFLINKFFDKLYLNNLLNNYNFYNYKELIQSIKHKLFQFKIDNINYNPKYCKPHNGYNSINIYMKKKLDLQTLMDKYNGDPAQRNYFSPTRSGQYDNSLGNEFYQRPNVNPIYEPTDLKGLENFKGNFPMSKSQCQQFLLKVREDLKGETKTMSLYVDTLMKQIHQKFMREHQKIKKQILDLLQKAFTQNQRRIKQQLETQGKIQPPQFSKVARQIQAHTQDIDRLLYQLRSGGNQYRRAISEVVMKDYASQIADLRNAIKQAKQNYLSQFAQIEPDRQRIQCIREDLHHLFRITKKQAGLINKVLFQATKQPERPPNDNPQRQDATRRSFFNFGL